MTKKSTVLGLSLGTRKIGLAVVKNGDLKEWCVKEFKGYWCIAKLKAIMFCVYKFCTLYGITSIAIKIPRKIGKQTGLRRVVSELERYAESQNIQIQKYSQNYLKLWYCGSDQGDFQKVIEIIVLRKPELVHEHRKEQRNYCGHYEVMFQAVAVALIVSDEILSTN